MLPLVSVVTVTYNSARYVKDTIESVLAQDYSNIEYIIGDDCSTDDTWNIIQGYHDPRIRNYRNDKNLREYPNRNKAIGLATGKYLIFIDGDDIIFPHGVSFFVTMMEAFPDAGMAIQKNYQNNLLFPALLSPEDTLKNHFYGKVDLLSSSFTSDFFRTDLLKKWKLSERYIVGDEEIRLKLAFHHPVLFVAGWVSWPRETPNQASSRIDNAQRMAEIYQFSTELLSKAGALGFDADLTNDMQAHINMHLSRLALHYLRKGKAAAARQLLSGTGFTWQKVYKFYAYRKQFDDVLASYTTSNPYRNGFLNKVSNS